MTNDKKTLAERLASRREKKGILSEDSIRRLLGDFLLIPITSIIEQPGEEINVAQAYDLFHENGKGDLDVDKVTIGEWMSEVEDCLDRASDAQERLACYKKYTEGFTRNLKKARNQTVMNFLQINYSTLATMLSLVSDYITQEFFDRIVTNKYVLEDGRTIELGVVHENTILKKLQVACSDEKLTVEDFLNTRFPVGAFKPNSYAFKYFGNIQATWALQYLGFWRLIFKAVKEPAFLGQGGESDHEG